MPWRGSTYTQAGYPHTERTAGNRQGESRRTSMAGAAGKKAAAARKAAEQTYLPIVSALNLGYILLRIFYQGAFGSMWSVTVSFLLVGASVFSYRGILEDHENTIPNKSLKGDGEKLAGGASLDLLGLLTLVQYGTVFISPNFYWILAILPVWGAYKLFTTFFGKSGLASGMMGGGGDPMMDQGADASLDVANAKRQKRAERRRQKVVRG